MVALTTDLFLQSRIAGLAGSLGVTADFAADSDKLMGGLNANTILVILDLSAEDHDPFAIVEDLKASWPSLRILGFFPHVKSELKTRAENAGVDVVVPNSKFMETLKGILAAEV